MIADKIRSEIPPVDIAEVMAEIEALLDQSIGAEGYLMPPVSDPNRYVDLSQIDFEALRDKFEGSRKPVEVQKLGRSSVQARTDDPGEPHPDRLPGRIPENDR